MPWGILPPPPTRSECQNCKHWMTDLKPCHDFDESGESRCCEIVSFTDYSKPDFNEEKQAFIAVTDEEPVCSGWLFTRPTFGCNLFEPKDS